MENRERADAGPTHDSDIGIPSDSAAASAAEALSTWITDHPGDSNAGGVRILKDRSTVIVYWKGTAPSALQRLAAGQRVPIKFKPVAYSSAELAAAVHAVMLANPDVTAAGFLSDYSGIQVTLSSKAAPKALATAQAATTVPIVLRGTSDPQPRDRSTPDSTASANGCPDWGRCADSPPH